MDHLANIGAVCFLQDIMHPIAVARKVMELTPHVMLVGKGAQKFALDNGFKKEQLLTPSSEAAYKKWLQQSNYEPWIGIQNHDTIGMLAIDSAGNISGACTTSGLAYKMHGRVGDSPIIGAGLFVDNEVGGATATGVGEEVIRICGSHTVVEKMRSGASPEEACAEACKRIAKNMARRKKNAADYQIGFLALDKNGNYGAHSFQSGFDFAITTATRHELIKSNFNNG
jgi:isoaspartyl peptidase/L-asparaginase-like protein (Ntn-hydrolase superfamily)